MRKLIAACPRLAAWMGIALAAVPAAAARLTVVTTTTDLKALTEAVGGDHAAVASIACGYEDPHFVQAKPSYMMTAREADLWVRVGMELEIGWEELVLDGSRNPRIRIGTKGHLDASEGVLRLEVPTTRVTREMGDIHPMGNPHVWLDPLNARLMAKAIADRLALLRPEDADAFKQNLRAFTDALDRRMFGDDLVKAVGGDALWAMELKGTLPAFLDERRLTPKLAGWAGRMRPWQGAKIVTYHRSWSYFANRFRLVVAAELEPKPGIPPSPSHLANVVGQVKAQGIKVILAEPFYSRKAPDFVAAKTDATVLVCPNSVGGTPEATDCLALMDLIVDRLIRALGRAAPESAK
jgi:zinc/manganese transport system substrate-binding protein